MKLKILVNILLLLFVSSCFRMEGPQRSFKKQLDKADPDFRLGWYDGCHTGSAAAGDAYYQSFAKKNVINGWKYSNTPDYKNAWDQGFWYCYRDDAIDQKGTPYKSFFAGFL